MMPEEAAVFPLRSRSAIAPGDSIVLAHRPQTLFRVDALNLPKGVTCTHASVKCFEKQSRSVNPKIFPWYTCDVGGAIVVVLRNDSPKPQVLSVELVGLAFR